MVFSIVKLTTDTGISDQNVMIGIPNVNDVKRSKLYRELVEDCGCSKYILVTVRSVEVKGKAVKLDNDSRYAIILGEEITLKGEANAIQRRNLR